MSGSLHATTTSSDDGSSPPLELAMSESNVHSVSYRPTAEDTWATATALTKLPPRRMRLGPWIMFGIVVAVFFVLVSPPAAFVFTFVAGCVVASLGIAWLSRRALTARRRALAPREGGPMVSEHRAVLFDDRFEIETPFSSVVTKWDAVTEVIETPTLILLRIDTFAAHAIPKRAFASVERSMEFRDFARSRIGRMPT